MERPQRQSLTERARDGEGDSFEKTVASGASFTHLVNERWRSVGFGFADWEEAHSASGSSKGVDRESRAAELGNGRKSVSESASLARPAPMSCSWRVSGTPLARKTMANMEHTQNLGNCGALLCELVIDRNVPVLDALTHAQEFLVVTLASNIQVALPSACIDRLFQLVLIV